MIYVSEIEIEESLIKSCCEDPYSQHPIGCFHHQGSGASQGCLLLHFYSTLYWKLANSVNLEKVGKGIQIRKKNKAFPSHSIIFYLKKNHREYTHKTPFLELISEFCKVAEEKINVQKSIIPLYSSKQPTIANKIF